MTLREVIRMNRTNYGLSQKEVGEAVGASRNYINMVENNTGNVGLSMEKAKEIIDAIYKIGEEKKKADKK